MSNTDEAGSPVEQDGAGQQDDSSKTPAPKDRQCPFCNTPFTSSSLGRHLDLYIKDKNPKPPDGVHDVNKIRQMRGKITRRHPKGSSAAARSAAMSRGLGESPTGVSVESSARMEAPFDDSLLGSGIISPSAGASRGANPMNRLQWQATGVINDLPAKHDRTFGTSLPSADNTTGARQNEPGEGAPAAELALRDLVKNLQRAAARIQRPGPFDYDVFSLNFPAMCLKLLPAPPTLFSTTPSHSNTSWPIDPPATHHLDLIKTSIRKRLKAFMQVCPPLGIRMCSTRAEAEDMISSAVESEFTKYEEHANCVHSQWQELAEEARAQVWHLEVMRALSKLLNDMSDMSMKYHRAQDQYESTRAELDRIKAKTGEGVANRVNYTPFVSNSMIEELSKIEADPEAWQYQPLLDRYRDTLPGPFEGGPQAVNGNRAFDRRYFPGHNDSVDVEMTEEVVRGLNTEAK